MNRKNKIIYGDSKISPLCKDCCFENEPFNYGYCENCIRNTEILESKKDNDNWKHISKEYDYYDCR